MDRTVSMVETAGLIRDLRELAYHVKSAEAACAHDIKATNAVREIRMSLDDLLSRLQKPATEPKMSYLQRYEGGEPTWG